jgi:hypothetical protein
LTTRCGNRPEEARREDAHEAGEHHEVGLVRGDRVGQVEVPPRPVRAVLERHRHGRDPRVARPLQRAALRPVGADRHDAGAVRLVLAGVQQRLQGAAAAGRKDDQSRGQGASSAGCVAQRRARWLRRGQATEFPSGHGG